MIHQLPRWVFFSAWVLALIAGMVNVVGILGFEQQAITHLTGTTSMLAVAAARWNWQAFAHFAALIGAFFIGCVFSGFLLRERSLQLGRRYGSALIVSSLLLFLSIPLLELQNELGMFTAAAACGLQNAMASTYSGAVVRVSHLSGMFTDLGLFLGYKLRGLPVDKRRLALCLVVVSGFFIGGCLSAVAYLSVGNFALALPAGLSLLMALASMAFVRIARTRRHILQSKDGAN